MYILYGAVDVDTSSTNVNSPVPVCINIPFLYTSTSAVSLFGTIVIFANSSSSNQLLNTLFSLVASELSVIILFMSVLNFLVICIVYVFVVTPSSAITFTSNAVIPVDKSISSSII